MFAVVRIAGKQVRVSKGLRLRVPKLAVEAGSKCRFAEVLLISNEGEIRVGDPLIEGAAVETTVLAHVRGEKVEIFKMRRRKNYRRHNGHRQYYTEVQVEDIILPN